MAINTTNNVSTGLSLASRNSGQPESVMSAESTLAFQQTEYPPSDKMQKLLTKEELAKISSEMTKFMQLVNSDIQFQVHDATKQLIVQVVDTRDGTILKEFPPHEMLDTIAKIKEYVGILLDKKV